MRTELQKLAAKRNWALLRLEGARRALREVALEQLSTLETNIAHADIEHVTGQIARRIKANYEIQKARLQNGKE